MEGLEERAEAEAKMLIERLYTHEILEVKHSSRDRLMERITEALCSGSNNDKKCTLATHTLVFRSGLSPASLRRLQTALQQPHSPIAQVEFVCLRTEEEISMALGCCRQGKIVRLRLENYRPAGRLSREDRQSMAETLRNGIFGAASNGDDNDDEGALPHATCVELVGYPIGAVGARVLAEAVATNNTLDVLRLMDCDLRSDSMYYIAQMIRENTHLKELDLSYNRHYLGSPLTREMTIKTLVNKGLKFNFTLQELACDKRKAGRWNVPKLIVTWL